MAVDLDSKRIKLLTYVGTLWGVPLYADPAMRRDDWRIDAVRDKDGESRFVVGADYEPVLRAIGTGLVERCGSGLTMSCIPDGLRQGTESDDGLLNDMLRAWAYARQRWDI